MDILATLSKKFLCCLRFIDNLDNLVSSIHLHIFLPVKKNFFQQVFRSINKVASMVSCFVLHSSNHEFHSNQGKIHTETLSLHSSSLLRFLPSKVFPSFDPRNEMSQNQQLVDISNDLFCPESYPISSRVELPASAHLFESSHLPSVGSPVISDVNLTATDVLFQLTSMHHELGIGSSQI